MMELETCLVPAKKSVDHQFHFIFPVRKGRRIAMNETWKGLSGREKRCDAHRSTKVELPEHDLIVTDFLNGHFTDSRITFAQPKIKLFLTVLIKVLKIVFEKEVRIWRKVNKTLCLLDSALRASKSMI